MHEFLNNLNNEEKLVLTDNTILRILQGQSNPQLVEDVINDFKNSFFFSKRKIYRIFQKYKNFREKISPTLQKCRFCP